MTRQEAIEWQEAFKKTYNGFPSDAYTACDMAIEALKKRPAYLRQIERYQERQKNQTTELHNLQARNDRLKAKIEHDTEIKLNQLEEVFGRYYGEAVWKDKDLVQEVLNIVRRK